MGKWSFTQWFLTFLASTNALIFARFLWRGLKALFAGVTRREADVLTSALQQRDDALERAERCEEVNAVLQRNIARREHIILSHGLRLPDDGKDTIERRFGQRLPHAEP